MRAAIRWMCHPLRWCVGDASLRHLNIVSARQQDRREGVVSPHPRLSTPMLRPCPHVHRQVVVMTRRHAGKRASLLPLLTREQSSPPATGRPQWRRPLVHPPPRRPPPPLPHHHLPLVDHRRLTRHLLPLLVVPHRAPRHQGPMFHRLVRVMSHVLRMCRPHQQREATCRHLWHRQ